MNCLIVNAHPLEDSLCGKFTHLVYSRLDEMGHQVVLENLYHDQFDPVLSARERSTYYTGKYDDSKIQKQARHLVEADAMVLIFPTWWFGFPAVLKGWFDRVWGPGIAYDHANDYGPIKPRLDKLKRVLAITTLGAPWWVDMFILRKPLQKVLRFAILQACTKNCQLKYISFYNCEKVNQERFDIFISKIHLALNNWMR